MTQVSIKISEKELKIHEAPKSLSEKVIKTVNSTSKCDKYVRIIGNFCKFLRALSPQHKKRLGKIYKQLLILRQVIRWQGIYQLAIDLHHQGWKSFQLQNITNLGFMILGAFGDILDRIIFILQILNRKQLQDRLQQIQKMESDCYFAQCIIWLFYHVRTARKVFNEGNSQQKKSKVLKIIKYILDSITSYCKFSRRKWQLQPKRAAFLGIISSCIGIYQILK